MILSRRKAAHHRHECPCPWCKLPHGPADVFEAWQGVGEHKLGIAIVLALAALAIVAGLSI